MTPRQIAGLVALFAGVIVVAAVAGVGLSWLLLGRPQTSPPALTASTTQPAATQPAGPTTRPALLDPAESVTLTGKAICGTCFLKMGPTSTHPVVLETKQPYQTFVLAENDRLKEIEALTGSCANGDYELTVTGDVLVVVGRNVMVVDSFTHRTADSEANSEPDEDS